MRIRLSSCIKGLGVALATMAIYAVSIGCLIALTLLVVSMEEGGDSLSGGAMALTQAVVLLSQGVGFRLGALAVSVMPLLLTILLICLIAQLARRFGAGFLGWVTGTVAWTGLNLAFLTNLTLPVMDSTGLAVLKASVVFMLGYAAGTLPGSTAWRDLKALLRERVSAPLLHALRLGLICGLSIILAALTVGFVAVMTWIALNHGAVGKLFEADGMEIGSRILTSVLALAWLPNAVIWGVSWCCGAGLHIGDIADFSLWSGQGDGLPALPFFALLPAPVESSAVRMAIQLAVPVIAFVIAMIAMLLPRGFRVRPITGLDRDAARGAILAMAYPAGAFCLAAGIVAVGMSVVFALSNGGLGDNHLSHVGVDVTVSTQAVGRPVSLGLFAAWLALAIVMAAVWGIHWLWQHHIKEGSDGTDQSTD